MADITCTTETLTVTMKGLHKLLAFKSRLEVPLSHVERIEHDPSVRLPHLFRIKMPGTYIAGVMAAGTFYQEGQRVFWDVRDTSRAVVIHLRDERYDKLIVEVEKPQETVQRVEQALAAVNRS